MTESASGLVPVKTPRRRNDDLVRGGPFAAGLVMLIAAITYLPLITQLGFYRDDWFVIWSGNARGAQSIVDMFEIDRPAMGYLYSLAFAVLGNNLLGWHLWAFGLRLIGALAFLRLAQLLFPGRGRATTSMALLFVVYPGFLQQPNANTFQNHFFGYAAALASILLNILALKPRPRWQVVGLTGLAVVLELANLLIYEYMVGLEGLRLILLWNVLDLDRKQTIADRLKAVFRVWIPYAIVLAGFLFWRIALFKSTRAATDLSQVTAVFRETPLRAAAIAGIETVKDVVEAGILGWFVPFYDLVEDATNRELLSAVLPAAAAVALLALYWRWFTTNSIQEPSANGVQLHRAPVIGALGLVCAIVPVVIAQRDVQFQIGFDRYTLHATAAVGILLGGIIFSLFPAQMRLPTVAFLISLGLVTHSLNARHWASFWRDQREIWWQLAWRAPQLEDGTTLLVQIPSEGFREDYEIWGPANLVYSQGDGSIRIVAEILNERTAQKVRFGERDARGMRGLGFDRDFNKVLILAMPTPASCLHVLDRERLEIPEAAGSLMYSIAWYSNAGQIDTGPQNQTPSKDIFGPEPSHTWCYYFQSASLARQRGAWSAIAHLGDEAMGFGFGPSDRSEWLPFVEGYLNVGRTEDAQTIVRFIRQDELVRRTLCERLPHVSQAGGETYEAMLDLLCEFN